MKQRHKLFLVIPIAVGFLLLLGVGRVEEVDIDTSSDLITIAVSDENQTSHEAETQQESVDGPRLIEDTYPAPKYAPEKKLDDVIVDSNGDEYPIRQYKLFLIPDDPNATQWWTTSTDLETAWDIGPGGTQTLLAIIDTGFDLGHEEFEDRWYQNTGETGTTTVENPSDLNCTDSSQTLDKSCNNIDDNYDGIMDNESGATLLENPSRLNCSDQSTVLDKACNLIDDDSNGLVDDVTGWDFANYDQVVEAGETNPSGQGVYHGTMVAGVAAATGNNGKGIAGVNWSTKVLPIQALDDDEYGDTLTVSRAIRYAADQGADVISLSLGTAFNDSYLRLAVDYAIEAGSLVVAASGNDSCQCINYPANFPEVVAVGATDLAGDRASFSNWGSNLDIAAPGVGIRTPIWAYGSDTAYAASVSGTSFSTPLVSGALALARSHQPSASWSELVSAIGSQTDRAKLGTAEHSTQYGFGEIDVGSAITRVTTPRADTWEYRFGPFAVDDVLSSDLVYQCNTGQYPAASLYKMTKSSQQKYTVSEYQRYSLESSGWTSGFIGYTCLGLPSDASVTVRTINLPLEIGNFNPKATL